MWAWDYRVVGESGELAAPVREIHWDGIIARRRPAARWRDRARSLIPRGHELPPDRPGRHLAPLGIVAVAVGFNLWVLRAEILPVLNLNDSSVHLSMVRWALQRIREGHLPFDGWYPYLGLGSSLFHHYQSLPHILTAGIGLAIGPDRAFFGTLYLLLASWPISVYLGARLLGWERWVAAAAAVISPLLVSTPGYGYEHGSYTWRGLGVWSQEWAMWLLPLAWGLSWRAVSRSKPVRYAVAALVIGLTAASHFLTGYLAFLALGVWVLVRPGQLLKRLGRAAMVGIGAVLIISWVVVPLLLDSRWSSQSQYLKGTFWFDSFGARRVLSWLFTGQLFDGQRMIPVISVLVGVGTLVCVVRSRRDERARALLGVMLISLLLFVGRPTLGALLKLLPGSDDLLLHRYIVGVHLAGILLAGVGAAWLGSVALERLRRLVPRMAPAAVAAAGALLGVAVLSPAWLEREAFDRVGGDWIRYQRTIDATDGAVIRSLVEEAEARGPGRIYAGLSGNWGADYRLWSVPVYAALLAYDADSIGFVLRTTSLSSDFEALFDETNPAHYDLFNVRYLILSADRPPSVPATAIDERNGNTLWEVQTTGYLNVVETVPPPIAADRTNLSQRAAFFLPSDMLREGRYPTIAFAGVPAAPPTASGEHEIPGSPGEVRFERASLADGEVTGLIGSTRPAMVILKSSFDPRWQVVIDGVELEPQMVAPSFVGRMVPAGKHVIEFRYRPFPRYDLLFAIGVVAFAGLWFGPGLIEAWARRRRLGRGEPHEPPS